MSKEDSVDQGLESRQREVVEFRVYFEGSLGRIVGGLSEGYEGKEAGEVREGPWSRAGPLSLLES